MVMMRRPTFEHCEERVCLTAIEFTRHVALADNDTRVRHVQVADMDFDNDADLVFASDSTVGWSENDGLGSFSEPRRVADLTRVSSLAVGDIDLAV